MRRTPAVAARALAARVLARRGLACAFAALLVTVIATAAAAQSAFPTRPVKVIVPFPGGGINDILARIVGEKLAGKWGQPVVVENKTGAGGNIGAEAAFQAEPDGYTLLLSPPGPLAINETLYKRLSYKPQEFVPLTVVGSVPNVVIVRKELPINSLKELIDYVKSNPGKISFGSQGNGATPHLTAMMFQGMTATRMVHIPYRGETLVLQDMLGGHVDVFFGNVAAARPQYLEGKVKVLAVLDHARAATLPDVPTAAEAGLPGLVATGWFAFAAPPKTSAALQTTIADAMIEAIKMPDVQARFRGASVDPIGGTPAEMAGFIKEEAQRWGEVIKKNNIVVD
ncbi:MAG: Bug family tripartite tricarboxylate transporter substrate binding protein [Xanthobacteraceae bacterium]